MVLLLEPLFSVKQNLIRCFYKNIVEEKTESKSGLGVLIFLAILIHKAPAAIGFGTFLYHEGLRNYHLAKHLCVRFISL